MNRSPTFESVHASRTSQTPCSRRILVIAVTVCLSIVLPAATAYLSVRSAFSRSGIRESHFCPWGSVKNGELWFPVFRYSGTRAVPPAECRISRLDLATGVQRETGLVTRNGYAHVKWMGDELYVYTDTSLYRMNGSSLDLVASLPTNSGAFDADPFLYDGRVTTVVETQDDGFCLVHLNDGKWVNGRRILIPGQGRVWYDDPQRAIRSLLPITSQQPVTRFVPPGLKLVLTVLQDERDTHVFLNENSCYSDEPHFAAYRNGFEFADEEGECASALAPENSPPEVSGWEALAPSIQRCFWLQMTCDRQGSVFFGSPIDPTKPMFGGELRFVRRTTDGRWENIVGLEARFVRDSAHSLVADPADAAYVIHTEANSPAPTVFHIVGNTIGPPNPRLPSNEYEYLARWVWLLAGLLLAWIIHVAVLLAGIHVCDRSHNRYEFGIHRVDLAPAVRRTLAFSVDLLLFSTILFVSWYIQSQIIEIEWVRDHPRKLRDLLCEIEWDVFELGLRGVMFIPMRILHPAFVGYPKDPMLIVQLILLAGIDTGLVVWLYKLYLEGRFGISPGKWLFGIRTVRSTLRPCGFGRALVRDVLYCVDIPFLVTPLPSAISMMLSPHRQRLGDRVADTIVIRHDDQEDTK